MMTNELLLIPSKTDIERDSVATSWETNGGKVLRVDKFWNKPKIDDSQRITIYGNDSFSLVLAQLLELTLIEPKDEVISKLSMKWIKREIKIQEIHQIAQTEFPIFIKPVKPKTFKSSVYKHYNDFEAETRGIGQNEEVILSEIISIESEVRAFILDNTILDMAIYEGDSDLDSARIFLKKFLQNNTSNLPKTYVIDLGFNQNDGWFVIEFNSSWGAGLNSCDPNKVLMGIREATNTLLS